MPKSLPKSLEGPRVKPFAGGAAQSLVVLLHGVGANGDDLIDLGLHWRSFLPETEFLSPHAPFPCDFFPERRQWFSVEDRAPDKLLAGMRAAAPILDQFLDEALAERGLDAGKLALVGFSQGAMMALHVGLRRKAQIAGVVSFSGALHGVEVLAGEIRSRPPVLLIHGEADDVVPFWLMGYAAAALSAAKVPVETLARPGLGHAIDEAGLKAAGLFLRAGLAPEAGWI